MSRTVPLYFWNRVRNFGDELSAAVVEWVTGLPVQHVSETTQGKLLAVGSILQMAKEGDVVWGTGVHPGFYHRYFIKPDRWSRFRDNGRMVLPRLKVLATRGPITRDLIIASGQDCPEIYGDPGLLTPLFYQPRVGRSHRVGLIPHFRDHAKHAASAHHVIDVQRSWQEVVDEICSCERVVSTSLHGVILAEAYGIPAIWLRETEGEGFLKYNDYYAGTGRAPRAAYSVEEALDMAALPPPQYDRDALVGALRSHFNATASAAPVLHPARAVEEGVMT
ncbi:polysaccharide pyruvyl transferase family protein [Uliginosibacterium sp. H1]|uniref:polysaccharide pyruvyl transferase family protein n=1 Tax=Uliginosibacterium sp. H1 TaxID=3114757 RepID=UPI002E16F0AD|nr:polysaccharide pyruvyl transferase family protein [Uliginosibacterium sp. H1]